MGFFIFKLNNDKTNEVQKSNELQAQVNDLSRTMNDLQGKITNISETINSNESNPYNQYKNEKDDYGYLT